MPKITHNRKTAPRARRSTDGRKSRSGNGRTPGRGPKETIAPVVASSVHSLRLKAVPSVRFLKATEDKTRNLVGDLKKCLTRITGEAVLIPKDNFENQVSLLISKLKAVSKGFDLSILEDKGRYHVSLSQHCLYVPYMPIMFVGPTLEKLTKQPREKKLFMDFLHLFIMTTRVSTWYWGVMDMVRDGLAERLHFEKDAYDPDDYQGQLDCLDFYSNGDPDEHAKVLAKKCEVDLTTLTRRVNRCKIPQLRKLMTMGCDLIATGLSVEDFQHTRNEEQDYYEEGLRFTDQSAILWRQGDDLCEQFDDYIDMYVQSGGVLEACAGIFIRSDKKDPVDIKSVQSRRGWPMKLAKFLDYGRTALEKYANDHLLINNLFPDDERHATAHAIIEA